MSNKGLFEGKEYSVEKSTDFWTISINYKFIFYIEFFIILFYTNMNYNIVQNESKKIY